jgi:hypothetical protein
MTRALPAALPAMLLAFALTAGEAGAREEAGTVGAWTMSLAGSSRACGLTLGPEPGPVGRAVRFPAGCRRALPILGEVAGWTVEGEAVRLTRGDGQALLDFAPRPDGSLAARGASGEEFNLTALARDSASGVIGATTATAVAYTPPAAAVPAPREGAVAGLYTLDRFVEHDTCRVALRPDTPEGGPAQLAEGCRDGGLAMFDPVSWRYEAGRLTLIARRGHEVGLVSIPGQRWRRDPETGTTFVLRRVEP